MTEPAPTMPGAPGAQDECATCGHARWRHAQVGAEQVCTEYLDCACKGVFVEVSHPTRMAQIVQAAQGAATQMVEARLAMTNAMRALHNLHTAMRHAGLTDTDICDGCDTVTQVQATDDGRAQLCASCTRVAANAEAETRARQAAALQQLATFHHVDCDRQNCDGTCTQERPDTAQLAHALDIPEAAITGPSPDGLPNHWTGAAPITGEHQAIPYAQGREALGYPHTSPRTWDDLHGPVPDELQAEPVTPHPDELQAAFHVGNSCATCWPRPCDPSRSQCRRHPYTTEHPHGQPQ
jgi:hypothetical protein